MTRTPLLLGSLLFLGASISGCGSADEKAKTPVCPTGSAPAVATLPPNAPPAPISAVLAGDEGMWLLAPPGSFPSDRVKNLYNVTIDQKWLDHARLSSVRLALGCSGSFVSPNGLVMTNHHCASECIHQLSSKAHDYLKEGWYAKTEADEAKCPGAEIDDLVDVTDVTAQINAATKDMNGPGYFSAQRAAKSQIEKACATSDDVRCDVVTLYHGGRYHLYKYKRFQDVRLVFAPEQAIAFFGGDPDNFNFPRYDLDVSFVRVYEGGKPAKIDHFFKWSQNGAKAGEPTFVVGNPGRTSRELTASQLTYERDVALPNTLYRYAEVRGLLTEFGELGKEQAREAREDLFRVENAFKALKGRHEALLDHEFFESKVLAEAALRFHTDKQTQEAWDAITLAQKTKTAIHTEFEMLEGGAGFRSDLFGFARHLIRWAAESTHPNAERLREYSDSALPALKSALFSSAPIYDDYEILRFTASLTKMRELLGADALIVKKVLGQKSPKELATELVKGSKLKDQKLRQKLFEGGKSAIDENHDPMMELARLIDSESRAIRKRMEDEVASVEQKNGEIIAKARFAALGTSSYPDATFTLRIAYGHVEGWVENGVQIPPFTTIGGAFDRATGRDPFELPKSWIQAKSKLDLTTPFDVSLTNDVIGGNSGSPLINANGEIVGLIFDGNIHSLGGDYGYDPKSNRSIAVTSTALWQALDKVYGAQRLLAELKR